MSDYPTQPPPFADHATPGPRRGGGLQIFGFPLQIDLWFFLMAWMIGGRQEPQWMLLWVIVVLVGILAHELGHAFAGRRLGLEPQIHLYAFGGMTSWRQTRPLAARQHILISIAGPLVGIAVGGLILLAAQAGLLADASPILLRVLDNILWVNLGWGLLNLLPILPLDGGHIASSLAEILFGRRGRIAARALSIVLLTAIALWAVLNRQWWILILGVALTASNVQALKAEISA